jgi:hypothetical protein
MHGCGTVARLLFSIRERLSPLGCTPTEILPANPADEISDLVRNNGDAEWGHGGL